MEPIAPRTGEFRAPCPARHIVSKAGSSSCNPARSRLVSEVTDDLPDEQRELPYQGGHGQDLLVGRRARVLEQVHYFDVMTS